MRKRLDLTRPVERSVIEECLRVAQQAPTASNMQSWHFVVVTDGEKRRALAELYRKGWAVYSAQANAAAAAQPPPPAGAAAVQRVLSSAQYLMEHFHEVPVHVIPCISPRPDAVPMYIAQASMFGSIIPAAWSFMLAARARGLGGSWTTLHLFHEKEAAELLGIPFDTVAQVALIPLAYTKGTDFKPGPRLPLERMVHWGAW